MTRKTLSTVAAGLVLLALATLWFARRHPSHAEQRNVVKVGAILPLTGAGAPFGHSSKNALILAQEELNTRSTNLSFKVLIEDGMTDPTASVSAFNHLHDAQGTRLFITSVSSVSLALAPLAGRKAVLLFANASHPQVTEGHRLVFRYSNLASDEARAMLDFITQQQPSWPSIYVIALNDDYGRAYEDQITRLLRGRTNISVLGREFYDKTTTDLRTVVSKAIAAKPAVVVIVGFGRPLGLCVRQLRELGHQGPFIASLGFVLNNDAVVAAGDSSKGGYYLNFTFVAERGAQDFRQNYRTRFGTDPAPNAVIDYGTLYLLADAVRAVGPEPEAIAKYFRAHPKLHLPTGDVSISPAGDIAAPVTVMRIPPSGKINLWDMPKP